MAFIDALLSLPGDLRRHALVVFTHNLDWFYAIDPTWSEQNLLSILETDSKSDQEAFWGGFFWGAKIPRESLYNRLKPYLLGVAEKGGLSRRGHAQVLSGIILAGWGSTREGSEERFVIDEEFRNVLIRAMRTSVCRFYGRPSDGLTVMTRILENVGKSYCHGCFQRYGQSRSQLNPHVCQNDFVIWYLVSKVVFLSFQMSSCPC